MPRLFHVTPTCCAQAQATPAVILECGDDLSAPPQWVTWVWNPELEAIGTRPACACPFCGVALPGIRRREVPLTPLWTGDDYRCATCGERIGCCECYPPEAQWEPGE